MFREPRFCKETFLEKVSCCLSVTILSVIIYLINLVHCKVVRNGTNKITLQFPGPHAENRARVRLGTLGNALLTS